MMKREVNTGIIKSMRADKGFGFIEQDESEEDIFFHATGVLYSDFKDLREGQKVEYFRVSIPKGIKAIGVIAMTETESIERKQ